MLKILSSLILFLFLGIASVQAQDPESNAIPNTNAAKQLVAWIHHVNHSDTDNQVNFLTEHYTDKTETSLARRQRFMQSTRDHLKKATLTQVIHNEENKITAVISGQTGAMIQLTISTSAESPHGIDYVMVEPFNQNESKGPEGQLSDEEIARELELFAVDQAGRGFSGAILLAKGDKVLFKNAYGLASRRFNVPNQINTKFNLGSMNKMFTAVSVLQLVQQGRLSLDDPLSKFIGDAWLPSEITDKIQLKHLLSHTSGLGSYFNDRFSESSRASFRNLNDYRRLIADETLAFEPGSNWQYSNTGMLLLGVVIEKVTGESYFNYVRQHVYQAAGMKDSDAYDMDQPIPNLAIGYWKDGDQWKNNLFLHVVRGGPAGGGYSTIEDLHRFSQSLTHFQLLDKKYTRILVTPKQNSPRYGFGFEIESTAAGLVVGHGGGFPGIETKLDIFLDAGYIAIVLSNTDNSGGRAIRSKMQELVARKK